MHAAVITTYSVGRLPRRSCLVLFAAVVLAGCGGSERDAELDVGAARQQFQTTCRSCHALSDAEAAGVFGPDLDLLQPSEEEVLRQIERGGGGMPAELLRGQDARDVARYVAQVAGAPEASPTEEAATDG